MIDIFVHAPGDTKSSTSLRPIALLLCRVSRRQILSGMQYDHDSCIAEIDSTSSAQCAACCTTIEFLCWLGLESSARQVGKVKFQDMCIVPLLRILLVVIHRTFFVCMTMLVSFCARSNNASLLHAEIIFQCFLNLCRQ